MNTGHAASEYQLLIAPAAEYQLLITRLPS
jgi:hypothetical protein